MIPFTFPVVAGLLLSVPFFDQSKKIGFPTSTYSAYYSVIHQPQPVQYKFINPANLKIISGFNASWQNGERTLTWMASKENSLSHFEIEFAGAVASNFKKIGAVAADSSVSSYSFTDIITAKESINYYRLKIVEKEGAFRYSSTIVVKYSVTKFISVFPNPSKEKINIATLLPMKNATLKIVDSYGRVVYTDKNISGTKTNISISSLPAGFYFVRVEDGNVFYSSKFIK